MMTVVGSSGDSEKQSYFKFIMKIAWIDLAEKLHMDIKEKNENSMFSRW